MQRPILRTSCLQSQLSQFVEIIPDFFGAKFNEQPWEPFANCDLLQHYWKRLKTNAIHSELLKSLLKFLTVCSKCARQRNHIFTRTHHVVIGKVVRWGILWRACLLPGPALWSLRFFYNLAPYPFVLVQVVLSPLWSHNKLANLVFWSSFVHSNQF